MKKLEERAERPIKQRQTSTLRFVIAVALVVVGLIIFLVSVPPICIQVGQPAGGTYSLPVWVLYCPVVGIAIAAVGILIY